LERDIKIRLLDMIGLKIWLAQAFILKRELKMKKAFPLEIGTQASTSDGKHLSGDT
jgi:hypothetical protein